MELQLERYEQITPEFLEQFRTKRNLSLAVFWNAIGCSDTRGFRYEKKKTEIPEVVKRLVYLQYGLDIPTDCQSEAFQKFEAVVRNNNAMGKELVKLGESLALYGATGKPMDGAQ